MAALAWSAREDARTLHFSQRVASSLLRREWGTAEPFRQVRAKYVFLSLVIFNDNEILSVCCVHLDSADAPVGEVAEVPVESATTPQSNPALFALQ